MRSSQPQRRARRLVLLFALLAVSISAPAFFVGSWDAPPDHSLAEAEQAVQRAWQAEGDRYCPEDFVAARAALTAARDAIASQERLWALFRDYTLAQALVKAARVEAEQARRIAPLKKRQARSQAETAQIRARQVLQEASSQLEWVKERAPAWENRNRWSLQLASAREEFKQAESLLETGALFLARERFLSAQKNAGDLVARIEQERELSRLQCKGKVYQRHGLHIVVDTLANRLYLKDGRRVILEAVCSTGSDRQLEGNGRSWVFRTPKGKFKILSKVRDPVWRKPDWAYLEEGEPIPEDENLRYEKDMLGEYALGFTESHFIHGTRYEHLLGQNVTHGCIRLGREDLLSLSQQVRIGTPVYIQ